MGKAQENPQSSIPPWENKGSCSLNLLLMSVFFLRVDG
jgi:hypothetical protein